MVVVFSFFSSFRLIQKFTGSNGEVGTGTIWSSVLLQLSAQLWISAPFKCAPISISAYILILNSLLQGKSALSCSPRTDKNTFDEITESDVEDAAPARSLIIDWRKWHWRDRRHSFSCFFLIKIKGLFWTFGCFSKNQKCALSQISALSRGTKSKQAPRARNWIITVNTFPILSGLPILGGI